MAGDDGLTTGPVTVLFILGCRLHADLMVHQSGPDYHHFQEDDYAES